MNQPPLPTKTKIAALIMIGTGGIAGFFGLATEILSGMVIGWKMNYFILTSFGLFLISLCLLLFGVFLLRKKKWAWWSSIIIIIMELFDLWNFPVIPPLVPTAYELGIYLKFNFYFTLSLTFLLLISLALLFIEKKAKFHLKKPSLPIKTKISAWMMIITGSIFGIIHFGIRLKEIFLSTIETSNLDIAFITSYGRDFQPFLFAFLLLFLPGLSLFIKEKGGFWFFIVGIILFYAPEFRLIFSFGLISFISRVIDLSFGFTILLPLIALIFLVFDYKNYWKTCLEAEKLNC